MSQFLVELIAKAVSSDEKALRLLMFATNILFCGYVFNEIKGGSVLNETLHNLNVPLDCVSILEGLAIEYITPFAVALLTFSLVCVLKQDICQGSGGSVPPLAERFGAMSIRLLLIAAFATALALAADQHFFSSNGHPLMVASYSVSLGSLPLSFLGFAACLRGR